MKKKLDTRFPAARIKKIMQVDEEVGKIALSTPVLVSKALEMFLQDLLDRTHNVMRDRGAKTLSSAHLKVCLEQHKEYDFLKDIAGSITDIASESQKAGASLEGPGNNSMGRGRKKRAEGDDGDPEFSGDSSRRGLSGGGGKSMKIKRELSSGRSTELLWLPQDQNVGKKTKTELDSSHHLQRTGEEIDKKEITQTKHEALQVKGGVGFDLNFDLNESVPLDDSPVKGPLPPAQHTACDSDEDYDAE